MTLKLYGRFLYAVWLGSVITTIWVRPLGEGFVRGYNVAFAFLITTAVVWLVTLPALGLLVVRFIRDRAWRRTLEANRFLVLHVAVGVLMPVVNGFIIRLRAFFEYR